MNQITQDTASHMSNMTHLYIKHSVSHLSLRNCLFRLALSSCICALASGSSDFLQQKIIDTTRPKAAAWAGVQQCCAALYTDTTRPEATTCTYPYLLRSFCFLSRAVKGAFSDLRSFSYIRLGLLPATHHTSYVHHNMMQDTPPLSMHHTYITARCRTLHPSAYIIHTSQHDAGHPSAYIIHTSQHDTGHSTPQRMPYIHHITMQDTLPLSVWHASCTMLLPHVVPLQ